MGLKYEPASEPLHNCGELVRPQSSELGTCKTVKAIFWPWLSGKSPRNFKDFWTLSFFCSAAGGQQSKDGGEREFFIDNLLVRIHFIIEMIRWTGLAPWEIEFPFPGILTSTFLDGGLSLDVLVHRARCAYF